jgi:hypothetical protein
VEAPVPEVDNQIIDNAAPKVTVSYAGKLDILRENADLDTIPLSLINRVRETTKDRPITRPGVRPRKYGLSYT